MSEGIFNIVQFGRQSVVGSPVAASTVFPVDTGFLGFELDRASESPDEDFGSPSREQAGRGSTGVRWATASLPFVARFEDIVHALEMHVDTIGTPTGTASPYTWAYTFDETTNVLSSAVKPYTVQYGVRSSTQDEWRAYGVVADTLDLSFDALTTPGNSMWKGTLGLVALTREPSTITASQSPPATLETMEGHLTTFAEGGTATAFGSLSTATATLKQFSLSSSLSAVGRAFGGSSDTASSIGRSAKGEITFNALIAISSTTKSDVLDIFEVAGGLPTERRWRLTVTGSGVNSFIIDFRARFTAVNVGDNDNERLYAVDGVWVNDSTLGGRGRFTLTNAVATIP